MRRKDVAPSRATARSQRHPRTQGHPSARRRAALVAGSLLVAQVAAAPLPPEVSALVRDRLGADGPETRYLSSSTDLNDDRRPELIVHLLGPAVCGTGGCPTLIFTRDGAEHRLVSTIDVTRPPIRASAATSKGWRSLIVHIGGGGAAPAEIELAFDGHGYPGNPTVSGPSVREANLAGSRILIEDVDSLESAEPLIGGPASHRIDDIEATPSFDCDRATHAAEQQICQDPELAGLDRAMAAAFATGMSHWPEKDRAQERMAQRSWLRERNDCANDQDATACIKVSYARRLVALQIRNGMLEAPTAVGYLCQGHADDALRVAFYNQTDPRSAVLTLGDRQDIAFATRSGSGARYQSASVDFWEHHGEASLVWSGESYTCQAQ